MNITGQFPDGIEVDGKTYREYELREQIMADEVEVMESEHAGRAAKNDAYFGVCVMAKRLRLTGLDRPVTPEMLMHMLTSDFNHLTSQDKEMRARRATFRGKATAAADAHSGPDGDRLPAR